MKLRFLSLSLPDEAALWWRLFSDYLREEDDDPSFDSPEYRDRIAYVNTRKENPLRLIVPMLNDQPAGLCSYAIYHDENEKCFLAEFGIVPLLRRRGLGTRFYQAVEREIAREGGAYIDLTPGGATAERFWAKQGFARTEETGDNGLAVWTKRL